MKASQKLIDHIKRAEAFVPSAYQDTAGVWTIGYGHTKGVKRGDRCTQFQAEQWLKEDLAKFEPTANCCRRIVTQGQYDAILDFIYNCGPGNFEKSTLKQYIESGRKCYEIQQQFMRWFNSGGKFQGGLYSRRIWEAARWAE